MAKYIQIELISGIDIHLTVRPDGSVCVVNNNNSEDLYTSLVDSDSQPQPATPIAKPKPKPLGVQIFAEP